MLVDTGPPRVARPAQKACPGVMLLWYDALGHWTITCPQGVLDLRRRRALVLCAVWQARLGCLVTVTTVITGTGGPQTPCARCSLELLACLPRQAWEWLLIQSRRLDMAACRSSEVNSLEATEHEFQSGGVNCGLHTVSIRTISWDQFSWDQVSLVMSAIGDKCWPGVCLAKFQLFTSCKTSGAREGNGLVRTTQCSPLLLSYWLWLLL